MFTRCRGGEVKNPGVLTVATDDEPESLDPAAIEDNGLGRSAVMSGYNRLLDIDPAGTDLIPSLATEVPSIDIHLGRRIDLHLQPA